MGFRLIQPTFMDKQNELLRIWQDVMDSYGIHCQGWESDGKSLTLFGQAQNSWLPYSMTIRMDFDSRQAPIGSKGG